MPTDRPRGLLLINLGTPDAPTAAAVRPYLRQFLSDPRVLDITAAGRWALVNLVIAPFRAPKSAEAYRAVWTEEGSPLLVYGEQLRDAVQAELGDGWAVELGMRYGQPSVGRALSALRDRGCDRIVVLPLFPQYSSAANGSAVQEAMEEAAKLWVVPDLDFRGAFFDHPGFLEAFTARGREAIDALRPDRVLFSYHGLPERHVLKADMSGGRHCLQSAGCCDALVDANRHCYRAQCYATSRELAARLGLADGSWEVAFQSRLGRDPWISPYTDVRVVEMARDEGVKRLAVFSPAFVADCLETLEEIAIRARDDFLAHGGEELALVPSLNAHPTWVRAVVDIAREHASGGRA